MDADSLIARIDRLLTFFFLYISSNYYNKSFSSSADSCPPASGSRKTRSGV